MGFIIGSIFGAMTMCLMIINRECEEEHNEDSTLYKRLS